MTYRFLTAQELAYIREHYPLEGGPNVAQALGRPVGSVHEFARRHGIRRLNVVAGAYTLELIRARCLVDENEYSPCWIWTGPENAGVPVLRHNGHLRSARQVVQELKTGRTLSRNQVVRMDCGGSSCLNPEHMAVQTRASLKTENAASEPAAIRRARVGAQVRQRCAVLDFDKARQIRLSDEPTLVLAARYGVSAKTIRDVRAGDSWRDFGWADQLGQRRAV